VLLVKKKKQVEKNGFWVKTNSSPNSFEAMNRFITDTLSAPVTTKKGTQSCRPIREGLHVGPDKIGETQQRLIFFLYIKYVFYFFKINAFYMIFSSKFDLFIFRLIPYPFSLSFCLEIIF
jgi:hypothetical protein